MPKANAWDDLIEALALLRQANPDTVSPLHCSHDTLWVMADPAWFNEKQLERLDELGFNADKGEGVFRSYRFGSA